MVRITLCTGDDTAVDAVGAVVSRHYAIINAVTCLCAGMLPGVLSAAGFLEPGVASQTFISSKK